MNIVLWSSQALLAAQFLYHGLFFLFPPPQFAHLLNAQFPLWFRLFLGVAEVLAGIGLILPGVTRVLPRLVPLAALGIVIVTASASVLHFSRGGAETGSGVVTTTLFVMAAFVAYMRSRVRPIAARGASRSAKGEQIWAKLF